MAYEVVLGDKHIIGYLGADNKLNYDTEKMNKAIKEIVAGQPKGSFFTTARIIYRWDSNRKTNNNAVYTLWKTNPIIQNRVRQLNALVFGRGMKWMYDESTQHIIDRFWRVNRLKRKLSPMCTDSQLYGEVFIGLYPQPSGDVLVNIYEANQVDIDFDPTNVYTVNKYIVTYKNEESGKDEQIDMQPIEQYLNEIEFANAINMNKTSKVRKQLGLNGVSSVKGKGVMVHVKFNNSSSEVYGTSDFKQIFDLSSDYMDFVGDRMTIHQMYGSPAYDIEIDTDDPNEIKQRVEELAGFTIGANPVHNKKEVWKPLEFRNGGLAVGEDEKILRGLMCAGTAFPEHLLFNQSESGSDDNTFAVTKMAEERQDDFGDAIQDIHRFVIAVAGGDPAMVDEGEIIFPEISTMSEKAKAETYVLKVGAKICSRKTAALNIGHNWDIEQAQILEEDGMFGDLMNNSDMAGAVGGRFSTKANAQDPNADDGTDNRKARAQGKAINDQVMGNRKASH